MINTRETVLEMLLEILDNHKPSHLVIARTLEDHHDLSDQDRSFIKKLCQGTVERKLTEDYIIDSLSSVKVNKLKPVVRNLLRMGIYQMAYMNVPDSAACNESVKIAKKRNLGKLSGFINAVLRNFGRNKEELLNFSSIKQPLKRLSLQYSMPEWIVKEWLDRYGQDLTCKTLEYFLTDNATSIRCNISKTSPAELEETLKARGIGVERGKYSDKCFKISNYGRLNDLEEFRRGLFTVQDESSVIEGLAADVRPGDRILDICAAPGGKTIHAADLLISLGGGGSVTACDLTSGKTALIEEAVARHGFANIEVMVNDATVYKPSFTEGFDLILADLPCSGLGIIGKKPDIKYNMTKEGQRELVKLQRQIIDNLVKYLKPGGRLIYSTCTINPEENEDNVKYLIDNYNFEPIRDHYRLIPEGSYQFFPGQDGIDGFFIAMLKKQEGKNFG